MASMTALCAPSRVAPIQTRWPRRPAASAGGARPTPQSSWPSVERGRGRGLGRGRGCHRVVLRSTHRITIRTLGGARRSPPVADSTAKKSIEKQNNYHLGGEVLRRSQQLQKNNRRARRSRQRRNMSSTVEMEMKGDAEASYTFSAQAGKLKVGEHVVISNRPCKYVNRSQR